MSSLENQEMLPPLRDNGMSSFIMDVEEKVKEKTEDVSKHLGANDVDSVIVKFGV